MADPTPPLPTPIPPLSLTPGERTRLEVVIQRIRGAIQDTDLTPDKAIYDLQKAEGQIRDIIQAAFWRTR